MFRTKEVGNEDSRRLRNRLRWRPWIQMSHQERAIRTIALPKKRSLVRFLILNYSKCWLIIEVKKTNIIIWTDICNIYFYLYSFYILYFFYMGTCFPVYIQNNNIQITYEIKIFLVRFFSFLSSHTYLLYLLHFHTNLNFQKKKS